MNFLKKMYEMAKGIFNRHQHENLENKLSQSDKATGNAFPLEESFPPLRIVKELTEGTLTQKVVIKEVPRSVKPSIKTTIVPRANNLEGTGKALKHLMFLSKPGVASAMAQKNQQDTQKEKLEVQSREKYLKMDLSEVRNLWG